MSNKSTKKTISVITTLTLIGIIIAILNDTTGFYEWLKQTFTSEKTEKSDGKSPSSIRNIEINEQGTYVEGNQTIIYENKNQNSSNPERKVLFYFYETDNVHCWTFPVLKMYDDKTFVLDVLVYDSNADTDASRFKGTWEFVFYKYSLAFSSSPIFFSKEAFSDGIEFVEGRLEFSKDTKQFSMWGCLIQKRTEIDMNRFKNYDILKDYDAFE